MDISTDGIGTDNKPINQNICKSCGYTEAHALSVGPNRVSIKSDYCSSCLHKKIVLDVIVRDFLGGRC